MPRNMADVTREFEPVHSKTRIEEIEEIELNLDDYPGRSAS